MSGTVVVSKEVIAMLGNGAEMAILPDGSAHLMALKGTCDKEQDSQNNEVESEVEVKPLEVTLELECARLNKLAFQDRVNAYQVGYFNHLSSIINLILMRIMVEVGHCIFYLLFQPIRCLV